MRILTIETTCDETAAAVVADKLQVLSSVVASQDQLHRRFAGVVPEIAARAHVERILPTIDEALRRANLTLADLDAIAVANTPGLAGSLPGPAGEDTCRRDRQAAGGNQPFARPHHARRMAAGKDIFPPLWLIVSGGHTSLY
jgi:N6-L-threonylcarbamoyladenine synthase